MNWYTRKALGFSAVFLCTLFVSSAFVLVGPSTTRLFIQSIIKLNINLTPGCIIVIAYFLPLPLMSIFLCVHSKITPKDFGGLEIGFVFATSFILIYPIGTIILLVFA